MSNYISKCRTNYFSVTDEVRLREILAHCRGEDSCVLIQSDKDKNKFGFYCKHNFNGLFECQVGKDKAHEECKNMECCDCENMDSDNAIDNLFTELQKILPDGEAIIYTEIGNEAMRYLLGISAIITKDVIRWVTLSDLALSTAQEMLCNPEFTTQMDY